MRAADGRAPLRHLRWRMVVFFFFATVISYIDRQALSVNAPVIREQYGLTNTQYSSLVSAFLVAYTLGQPVLGRLVDRLGTRIAFASCMLWWSLAGMLHAAARSFWSLASFRFLLGLGEAGGVPSAMRGISEWFPERERSLATGIFAGGTTIGALLAPPLVAIITLAAGWRVSFLATGTLGLVWLALWWRLYDVPERHPRLEAGERDLILSGRVPSGEPGAAWTLLRHRKPWGIIAGRFLVDPIWWFYVFWLPNYLSDARGFTLGQIGWFAWIPFLAADAGTFLGGWWSGWLLRRTTLTRARKTVLLVGASGTLFGVPAWRVDEAWLCLLFISLATFSIGLWATMEVTVAADILPPDAVGSMTGLSGAGAGVGGILFTTLTGWIVDRFSYGPVFVLAGVLPLVGYAALSFLMGEIRPVDFTPDRDDARAGVRS